MERVGPTVIAAACGWEVVAIATGREPTWTSLVRALPRRQRAAVVGASCSWLIAHCFPRGVA